MTKPSNPPEFPRQGNPLSVGEQSGMTIRDYFAGQIANGYVSDPRIKLIPEHLENLAHSFYLLADAMLKEREK